jgi:hypothetical protein
LVFIERFQNNEQDKENPCSLNQRWLLCDEEFKINEKIKSAVDSQLIYTDQ